MLRRRRPQARAPHRGRVAGVFYLLLLLACTAVGRPAWVQRIIVNDVTRINPIVVQEVIAPTSIEEIVAAVRSHEGPISIGGGRFSQGGQTATDRALQIDMRRFDKVLSFSEEKKEITVQTGITWRKIQEFIDPHGLSLRIMQSYANFTVGGSLSVNVHGRYVGEGPLVMSVRSIRIVLADGTLVEASPVVNSDVFYGAIGGYGALGVIVEATLDLTENVRVERQSVVMPLAGYRDFFFRTIRENPDVVFHNADIYPRAFDTVRAISYVRTDKPVTVADRLRPVDRSYWLDRVAMRLVTEVPGGRALRQRVLDPLQSRGDCVEWRNYEASYDVKELEPVTRRDSTYVLQEYFVPVESLERFASRMAEILNRHDVNTINVSIRHARKDPGTLLAWAKTEVFAFVLYYKQGTTRSDREEVAVWTREMIDAATSFGGAYYLPYQIHATDAQFRAAYPNADLFFALKKRLDPTNKFRNRLWDAYYKPGPAPGGGPAPRRARELPHVLPVDPEVERRIAHELTSVKEYARDGAQTYLTLPEWLLVYYPDEYARFLENDRPSAFPYFAAIAQFWSYYKDAHAATRGRYPFNWGYHLMAAVIGSSYTIENAAKGLYENTVGSATEWLAGGERTQEDEFAAEAAAEYVDFIRVTPWYEFPFLAELKRLWAETNLVGPRLVRKWERKLSLSAEYLVKAQYGFLIKLASKAAYGSAETKVLARAGNVTEAALRDETGVKVLRTFEDGSALLSLPRYEEFRKAAMRLAEKGVYFREIAGNDEILITIVAPAAWGYDLPAGTVLFQKPILCDPQRKRVGIRAPVPSLHEILLGLDDDGITIEHVYDY